MPPDAHHDRFRLDGSVALVTGASSGFGAHFVRVLADAGASVIAGARRREQLEDVCAEVPGAVAVPADVTDDRDCERLVATAYDEHGRLDVVVNNAGKSDGPVRAHEEDPDDFRAAVAVNLTAAFVVAKLAATRMIDAGSGGSIVNIASIHGLVGSAPNSQAGYVAAKAGLVNLTRDLALQWARYGIRVNAVAPGYFGTELTDGMLATESGRSWIERNTPLRRPGELHELDGPLLLLASEAGSYITGHTLVVDGGWTAR